MARQMRQLFIYWKLPEAQAQAAFAALQSAQAALRAAHPGLQTGLYRRSDATAGSLTTGMETYAMPGGVGRALQSLLVQAGAEALAPHGQPQRHIEVFDQL